MTRTRASRWTRCLASSGTCRRLEAADTSNILLLHYADLAADLRGQMHQIADRLGITVSEESSRGRGGGRDLRSAARASSPSVPGADGVRRIRLRSSAVARRCRARGAECSGDGRVRAPCVRTCGAGPHHLVASALTHVNPGRTPDLDVVPDREVVDEHAHRDSEPPAAIDQHRHHLDRRPVAAGLSTPASHTSAPKTMVIRPTVMSAHGDLLVERPVTAVAR